MPFAPAHMRQIYNVHKLDLQLIAKAFGLAVPPLVNLGGAV